jgi:hypothetical protein
MVHITGKALGVIITALLLLVLYCGICAFTYVSVCYLILCIASIVLLFWLIACILMWLSY